LFARYVEFYLRRNFHALHLLCLAPLKDLNGWPLLICANHPSWWDPLVGLYLSQRFFGDRVQYAPIAAKGITKYRFFEKLGFFGIEPAMRSGAATFLAIGGAVLARRDGVLWLTPQGEFVDVRRRPVRIEPGAGHLAHRTDRFVMLPLAIEYTFWNERYPEAFVCFGEPLFVHSGRARSSAEWTIAFAQRLERTQDALSAKVLAREARAFEPLLIGNAGVGGVYDFWRSLKARARGKHFAPQHGGS
jgi:1-acyl-sn-glycerol-3-phosphate acyltransferase